MRQVLNKAVHCFVSILPIASYKIPIERKGSAVPFYYFSTPRFLDHEVLNRNSDCLLTFNVRYLEGTLSIWGRDLARDSLGFELNWLIYFQSVGPFQGGGHFFDDLVDKHTCYKVLREIVQVDVRSLVD